MTRDGLDEATAKARAEAAVRLVNAALPGPPQEPTNWPAIGALLPHALAAAEAAERLGVGLETCGEGAQRNSSLLSGSLPIAVGCWKLFERPGSMAI